MIDTLEAGKILQILYGIDHFIFSLNFSITVISKNSR